MSQGKREALCQQCPRTCGHMPEAVVITQQARGTEAALATRVERFHSAETRADVGLINGDIDGRPGMW